MLKRRVDDFLINSRTKNASNINARQVLSICCPLMHVQIANAELICNNLAQGQTDLVSSILRLRSSSFVHPTLYYSKRFIKRADKVHET
jgi:hypothetical protein